MLAEGGILAFGRSARSADEATAEEAQSEGRTADGLHVALKDGDFLLQSRGCGRRLAAMRVQCSLGSGARRLSVAARARLARSCCGEGCFFGARTLCAEAVPVDSNHSTTCTKAVMHKEKARKEEAGDDNV